LKFSQFKLPYNTVNIQSVKELAEFQRNSTLKLAAKLTDDILSSGHFDKMKVSQALHIANISVSAWIKYMVEIESSHINNVTTAWFIDMLSKWFDLMLQSCHGFE
jgi:hypothetical protein